jgi:two-component system response regulator
VSVGTIQDQRLVMLVEDNPDDVELTRIAMSEAGMNVPLAVVEDGAEALEYLKDVQPNGSRPRPDLILLDLNLPKVDGREVLRIVKEDADLRTIPVIVLSTSTDDVDVLAAYRDYANGFVSKPVDFEHFANVMRSIYAFWLKVSLLPPHADPYADLL